MNQLVEMSEENSRDEVSSREKKGGKESSSREEGGRKESSSISWNQFKPLLNKYGHTPSDQITEIIEDAGSEIDRFIVCKGGWLKLYLTEIDDQVKQKVTKDIKVAYPNLWERVQLLLS